MPLFVLIIPYIGAFYLRVVTESVIFRSNWNVKSEVVVPSTAHIFHNHLMPVLLCAVYLIPSYLRRIFWHSPSGVNVPDRTHDIEATFSSIKAASTVLKEIDIEDDY